MICQAACRRKTVPAPTSPYQRLAAARSRNDAVAFFSPSGASCARFGNFHRVRITTPSPSNAWSTGRICWVLLHAAMTPASRITATLAHLRAGYWTVSIARTFRVPQNLPTLRPPLSLDTADELAASPQGLVSEQADKCCEDDDCHYDEKPSVNLSRLVLGKRNRIAPVSPCFIIEFASITIPASANNELH